MTNKTELKSCPFCGATAKLEDHRLIWCVRCVTCSACVLGERAPEPQSDEAANSTDWDHYKQTAIDAWNLRGGALEATPTIPCIHPPGCTSCSWCGFKPETLTPIDNNQKPVGVNT